MPISIYEAAQDLLDARERLGPAVVERHDLWKVLSLLVNDAATPTPPTLSEDLREDSIGTALDDYDYNELWDAIAKATRIDGGIIAISVRTFRAALARAQVKAS